MTALDSNKRYLIVGAGKTGQSVARYFQRSGVGFAMVDSRSEPPDLEIADLVGANVITGGFGKCRFDEFDVLVVSPGVALQTPEIAQARRCGTEIVGDIELFAWALDRSTVHPQVLAVTGSNGKSTVVSMLGAILRGAGVDTALGGNLGTPALDLLAEQPDADVYVLELSSFQLESTRSLRLAGGSVLNVSEDHMDRYATLVEYASAKREIYRHAHCCIYNAQDELTYPGSNRKSVAFSGSKSAPAEFGVSDDALTHAGHSIMPMNELRVPGRHNVINALAAMALACALPEHFDIDEPTMRESVSKFTGLPHRTQWVAERDGVFWYNDSKGTNVGATLAAIEGMPRPVVLIAGGDGKGADFSPLAAISEKQLRAAVFICRDGPLVAEKQQGKVDTYHEADMQSAVKRARQIARAGDSVLLSPACASFDMYKNYEARGDDFVATVKSVLV
jgi:UDP-N-acetylmuramoylalanine--D-glutamate ligase